MKILITLLALISSIAFAVADDCTPLIGSCEYYLCREKNHSCGDNGYYVGFAYKYCMNSKNILNSRMSKNGVRWSNAVAQCLRNSVDKIAYDESCENVKTKAIDDHAVCYSDAGFCDLSTKDQFNIMRLIHKELIRPSVVEQGFTVLNQCR